MPVSVESSTAIYRALKDAGVRIVSALPETWLVHLIRMAEDDRGDDAGAAGEGGGRRRHQHGRASRRREVGDADAEPRVPGGDQRHRVVRPAVSDPAAHADQPARVVRRAGSLADARAAA